MESGKAISMSEWIPVTERMPEVAEECLVWMRYTDEANYNTHKKFYSFGWVDFLERWHTIHELDSRIIEVIAWMPLPKPYERGK